MRPRKILFTLAFCIAAFAVCFAQEAQMGTWKLNEAKSKFPAGSAKNNTVVYEAAGDNVKITVDGTDKDGKPTHNEWSGKFDGKDYPVTGDPSSDTRAYKKLSDHKLQFTASKGSKKTLIGVVTVSADGKTRTVVTKSADGKDQATAVYEK
jgi:hypothetical protein